MNESGSSEKRIIGFVGDLMFRSKISEVVKALGISISFARDNAKLSDLLAAGAPTLVLVDLNITSGDPLSALEVLKEKGFLAETICFFSHVNVELGQRASALGATRVMARSKLFSDLPELLRSL